MSGAASAGAPVGWFFAPVWANFAPIEKSGLLFGLFMVNYCVSFVKTLCDLDRAIKAGDGYWPGGFHSDSLDRFGGFRGIRGN
ncbi:MAG: hypothetical protein ACTSQV_06330 [Alphaproteobacteria bacterium]